MKKFILFLLVGTIITAMFTVQAFAEESKTIPVKGTAAPTLINVSFPAELTFAINPNSADEKFIATTGTIVNNSTAKIDIGLLSISAATDTTAKVVAYDSIADWSKLGVADTKSKIALGIKPDADVTIWSPDETASATEPAGVFKVEANKSTSVALDAKHGNAWQESTALQYSICFRMELSED